MKRLLVFTMCATVAVPMAFAANPVTVDGGAVANGVSIFNNIQPAITSWASGEVNAGETAPFVINVVPAGGPYVERLVLYEAHASGEIMGDLVIKSSVPGTLAAVEMQEAGDGGDDGCYLYQSTADVTFIDLLCYPSLTAPRFDDEMFKIDGLGASAMNTIRFENCIMTEIDTGGNPLTTTRAGAYLTPVAASSPRTNSYAYFIQHWADPGELVSLELDNCVLYANQNNTGAGTPMALRTTCEDNAETITVNNTVISFPQYTCWRHGSGTGAGTVTMTGTDQTAGPDGCSVLYAPGADSPAFWIYSCPVGTTIDLSGGIIADVAGGISRGIHIGTGSGNLTLADLIIATPGENVVDTIDNASTWDNVTLHSLGLAVSAESAALLCEGGAGSLTVRDCIFSGPGTKIQGTLPTGGIDIDYCSFVESTDLVVDITARDDGIAVSYGSNIITNDPMYLSMDPLNAQFLDVDNPAYVGAASGPSDLGGGADCPGTAPVELTVFTLE